MKNLSSFSYYWHILTLLSTYAFENLPNRVLWKEKLITPFYFTYISNVLGLIVGVIKGFLKTEISESRKVKILEVLSLTALLITLLVYWGVLFPVGSPKTGIGWGNAVFVHLLTPLLMITYFYS